jgi:hypothetical protein
MFYINVVAIWKAAKEQFENIQMLGCFFHQQQAIYRKAQELGLQHYYRQVPNVRKYMRRLMSLAYLPAEHITPVFARTAADATSVECEPLDELFDYYERSWLQSTIWPVNSWCIYRRHIRTNNDVEGWHNRFNRKLGRDNHPNMYFVINKLHEEAALSQIYTECVAAHALTRDQTRNSRTKNGQLHTLWNRYDSNNITTYELLVAASELVKVNF